MLNLNAVSRYSLVEPRSKPRPANRYAGTCQLCQQRVDAGAGVLLRDGDDWKVRCKRCYVDSGLARVDREGSRNYRQMQQTRERQRAIERAVRMTAGAFDDDNE